NTLGSPSSKFRFLRYTKKRGQTRPGGLALKTMFFVSRYFLAIRTCSMEAGPRASSTSFFGVLGARYVSSTPRSARYIDRTKLVPPRCSMVNLLESPSLRSSITDVRMKAPPFGPWRNTRPDIVVELREKV